jgi:O-antigen biosynthesis protein WbqP
MALRVAAGVDTLMPGITGWAQINGRDTISLAAKVALEKEYLEKQSLWLDIQIVWGTFFQLLRPKGISH